MKQTLLVCALAVLSLGVATRRAQASEIFDFSFTNTTGNVPGTVTGQIVLPFNGDGSGAATHVYVDTMPPGLNAPVTAPFDATAYIYSGTHDNAFSVAAGQITSANFFQLLDAGPQYGSLDPYFELSTQFSNGSGNQLAYFNGYPSSPVAFVRGGAATYTLESSTPEPATLTILGTGLFSIGAFGVRWRRKTFGAP